MDRLHMITRVWVEPGKYIACNSKICWIVCSSILWSTALNASGRSNCTKYTCSIIHHSMSPSGGPFLCYVIVCRQIETFMRCCYPWHVLLFGTQHNFKCAWKWILILDMRWKFFWILEYSRIVFNRDIGYRVTSATAVIRISSWFLFIYLVKMLIYLPQIL